MFKTLEMKVEHKWTDMSFNANMEFWHDRFPRGNTLPRSIKEAKILIYRKSNTTPVSMIAHFIRTSTRREPHVRCAAKDGTRERRRKFLKRW
jgi:hypothetical protein